MRGISFKLKNEYNNYLFKIFDNTEVYKFYWNICDSEIIYKDENNQLHTSIFDKDIIDGHDFLKRIKLDSYYLVYADIKAFNSTTHITNIVTYDDFINSNCEIALFCVDTTYVELYCKNKEILNKIIVNCIRFGFSDLQILTHENDSRTQFSV